MIDSGKIVSRINIFVYNIGIMQGRLIAFVYLSSYVMYSVDYKIAITDWDLEHSYFGLVLYYLLRIE